MKRESVGRHECEADGCVRLIPLVEVFCAPHWNRLPLSLQLALLAARARSNDPETVGDVLLYNGLRRDARELLARLELEGG